MSVLKNPYVRIAISVGVAELLTPKIVNAFTIAEQSPTDSVYNTAMRYGVNGATTAFVFVALSMALGKPEAT